MVAGSKGAKIPLRSNMADKEKVGEGNLDLFMLV